VGFGYSGPVSSTRALAYVRANLPGPTVLNGLCRSSKRASASNNTHRRNGLHGTDKAAACLLFSMFRRPRSYHTFCGVSTRGLRTCPKKENKSGSYLKNHDNNALEVVDQGQRGECTSFTRAQLRRITGAESKTQRSPIKCSRASHPRGQNGKSYPDARVRHSVD